MHEAPLPYIRLLKFNMEYHASVSMIFLEKTGKGETSILFRNTPLSDSILNFVGLYSCIKKKCGLFIGFSCQFRHRVIHRDGLRWLAGDIWDHFPHFLMVQVNCTTSGTCSSLGFSTSGMNYSKIIQSLPKKIQDPTSIPICSPSINWCRVRHLNPSSWRDIPLLSLQVPIAT